MGKSQKEYYEKNKTEINKERRKKYKQIRKQEIERVSNYKFNKKLDSLKTFAVENNHLFPKIKDIDTYVSKHWEEVQIMKRKKKLKDDAKQKFKEYWEANKDDRNQMRRLASWLKHLNREDVIEVLNLESP